MARDKAVMLGWFIERPIFDLGKDILGEDYMLAIIKHLKNQHVKEIDICGVRLNHAKIEDGLGRRTSSNEGGCLSDIMSDPEAGPADARSKSKCKE